MSNNRQMGQEDVVHVHSGILLSQKRNESESVWMRWMNAEPVTKSEVSQKEKNKYCILMPMYGNLANGSNEPMCGGGMDMQT